MKRFFLLLFFLISLMLPFDAFCVVIRGVDEVRPYIQQGRAAEYLPQYEERAKKLEASGDLQASVETYLNAAHLARASGNYQKALMLGNKAVDLAETSRYFGFLTKALMQTGQTYLVIADNEKAIALFERAAQLGKRIRNRFAEAGAYERLANTYRKLGQNRKALDYLKQAEGVYAALISDVEAPPEASAGKRARKARQQFSNPGVVRTYVSILSSLGNTYLRLQDYDSALESLKKALYYVSDKDQILEINNIMGDIHYRRGDIKMALEFHQKALGLAEEIRVPWHLMVSLSKTALDNYQQQNYAEASERYARAIVLIEEQRSMLESEEMRSMFFSQMTKTYDGMITSLVETGNIERAFEYSERGRSRAFIDVLGSKVDLSRSRASDLSAAEMEFRRKMAAAEVLQEEQEAEDARSELEQLKKDYNRFLERMRKEDMEHASLLSVEPIGLREIQSLLGSNTVLVEFHILDDKVLCWTVRKQGIRLTVISDGRKSVTEKVRQFRTGIADYRSDEKISAISRSIFDLLLGRADIVKGENLVIVPHGVLHYLPFHALLQTDNRYLLEDHTISYLSSAGLMRFTSEKRKKAEGRFLAFGNPDLGNLIYNLRYAEREAREIAQIYPDAEVYLKKEALRSRIKGRLSGYGAIHFASHGEFSEDDPMQSSLMLSGDDIDSGRLTTAEVFGLNIDASLVVLSACETAIGRLNTGDELIGLTRAFIYAGTPSVITSLWRVNDKATFMLMSNFYRNLRTMGKAESLRRAQETLMKSYPHPYYWGAFILTGDPG